MKLRILTIASGLVMIAASIIMPAGAATAASNPCLNKLLTIQTKTGPLTPHMRSQVLACVRAAKHTGAGVIVMTVPYNSAAKDFNTSGRIFQLMLAKGCTDWAKGNGMTQPGYGHCAVDLSSYEGGPKSGTITMITGGIGDG